MTEEERFDEEVRCMDYEEEDFSMEIMEEEADFAEDWRRGWSWNDEWVRE